MNPSIGEKIIAAITSGPLVRITNADRNGYDNDAVFVWTQSAAEQLEAVVEAYIEERVKARTKKLENALWETCERLEDEFGPSDGGTKQRFDWYLNEFQ